jgi:cardiolipin synthase C
VLKKIYTVLVMSCNSVMLNRRKAGVFIILFALLSGGCASLPDNVDRPTSFAIEDVSGTKLHKDIEPLLKAHAGLSGFYPLTEGMDAFATRLYLVDTAGKTLDLQYYIWHDDLTGKVLYDHLLAAADRGVRVRILLDDLDTAGKDQMLHIIDAHPNVEVRLFNPFANRERRVRDFVGDTKRINRRMHNKTLTADNQVSIFGGRNIGDEYFNATEEVGFKDMDVLTVGPVVNEVSQGFDLYWNSRWVYPLSAFKPSQPVTEEMVHNFRLQSEVFSREASGSKYADAIRGLDIAKKTGIADLDFAWSPWVLVYDQPGKVEADKVGFDTHLAPKLKVAMDQAQQELIIVSPYFVPGEKFTEYLVGLVEKGVRVRIMTNSLASNDVPMVHAGYMRYRKELLKGGVELYEFKPIKIENKEKGKDETKWTGSSRASLHGKYLGFDQRYLFIGSFNLDGRSTALNTELGVYFESEKFARALHDAFNARADVLGYRLVLDDDDLVWITREDGHEIRFEEEPETGFWKRFSTGFLSIIVPESQL